MAGLRDSNLDIHRRHRVDPAGLLRHGAARRGSMGRVPTRYPPIEPQRDIYGHPASTYRWAAALRSHLEYDSRWAWFCLRCANFSDLQRIWGRVLWSVD